jgi:hypothetical protein
MGVWGIMLRDEQRRVIGKSKLRGFIQSNRITVRQGDEFAGEMHALPFDTEIPPAPEDFDGSEPLSFALTSKEKDYLRVKMSHLARGDQRPSLLEKLVSALEENASSILNSKNCWDAAILELAGEDRVQLGVAERAAVMASVGRGVYAALVERLRNEDRNETKDFHQTELDAAIGKYRAKALELDLEELQKEIPTLPVELLKVLKKTQEWLRQPNRNLSDLEPAYREAESKRKQLRARLSRTQNGRSRRDDWETDTVGSETDPKAQTEPLHYRWYIVRAILADLHGESHG